MLTRTEQQALLQKLISAQYLTRGEFFALLDEVYQQSNDILLGAILTVLKTRKESVDNICFITEWLQNNMIKVARTPKNAIDICGTGGDTCNTFNVSTAAAFVIAEAGIPVIKHGGRSSRGLTGSSDVLYALQVSLCQNPGDCALAIQRCNLAFLNAPSFHHALAKFRFVRRQLGIPTILNIAAAIANPADVTKRVIGVYSYDLVETVAETLYQTEKIEHALVVHGIIDEITICGKTAIAEVNHHGVSLYEIEPEMFGLNTVSIDTILGGDAEYNASIIGDVLSGTQGPCADIVALNAGAGIYVGGGAKTLRDGIFIAKEILKSGKGLQKLEQARAALK